MWRWSLVRLAWAWLRQIVRSLFGPEELAIGIEFSCRVGTCGVCKVKITSGTVDMAVQDALDAEDKTKGIILACQAKPTSEVTVEA